MFKRRTPRTPLQNLREVFWPSMGWWRAAKYTKHRMVRLADTTHKIAAGLALGAAISFSPLVGTHFVQVAIIGYFWRINVLAGFVGTFVGNPWTFPFIWWSSFKLGMFLFSFFGWQDGAALPDEITMGVLWDLIKTHPMDVFLPWMLGGYLIGFFVWFPAYFIYYYLIKAARAARRKMRMHRIHQVAQEVTGQDH